MLLYGHLDKQPEMTGWREGLGPWTPVLARRQALRPRRRRRRLLDVRVARGARARCASRAMPHARCVVLIEGCEESGSFDLPLYIEHLRERIGTPSLVVCLDSGCGNYDQLWCTTSLRGMVIGNLHVDVLREGVHSGDGQRGRAVELSHRAAAARPARGRDARARSCPTGSTRRDSRGSASRRRRPWRPRSATACGHHFPCARHDAARYGRRGRADPEPHLAAAARDHRARPACRSSATPATCCAPARR